MHWDGVIQSYREQEIKVSQSADLEAVVERMKGTIQEFADRNLEQKKVAEKLEAVDEGENGVTKRSRTAGEGIGGRESGSSIKFLPHVHALELLCEGEIHYHIDNVEAFGSTLSGLSLLSDSVMVFTNKDSGVRVAVLLPQNSFYIVRDLARYDFGHELLGPKESVWKGVKVERGRRISLMLRSAREGEE
eukprot:TRINITY_DN2255_c0_g1_i1.p1 TRINITY_DN2255_c0_g1~~TRINITY_DN2255_c0_g1_i1.p1  ORF type:complete len:190 (+),score=18.09 TRINITY_DN2255_c0_g1_i1:281-850(+)